MQIGIISDSHDDVAALRRAGEEFRRLGVGLVIHGGDWVSPFAARILREALGDGVRVVGVWGNNEGEKPYFLETARGAQVEILGDAGEIEVGGRRVAVYHGTSPVLLKALIKSSLYDVVIYGHTHRAAIERWGNTLAVNPGELCGCLTGRASYALVDLKTLEGQIVLL
ncbi:MAG: metallophosphoesterase [Pyrobaculum sp.]